MIALQSDCLLFQLTSGESVPCSAEMVTVEIVGNNDGMFDQEMIQHAAASVFHYFRHELKRETVTVGEFAGALEKVLRDLGFIIRSGGIEALETIETLEHAWVPGRAERRNLPATLEWARGLLFQRDRFQAFAPGRLA